MEISTSARIPCSLQALGRRRSVLPHDAMKPRPQLLPPRDLSCKATGGGDGRIDRRDVLLGLGGAAAAAGLGTGRGRGAIAAPIQAPDPGDCHPPDLPDTAPDINCCPAYATGITDFRLPQRGFMQPLRVRPAAHLVDAEYLAKYERAVALMKQLPADDPRSFQQQWRVHCAYCDGAYDQVGFPDLELQIHNCWLFFPWHRYVRTRTYVFAHSGMHDNDIYPSA